MPSPFEAEIHALLHEVGDPALVVDELARRWELNLLTATEQNDCAEFFVQVGAFGRLFEKVGVLADDHQPLPWASFAEALGRARLKPTEAELDALFDGARAQNALGDLVRSHQLDIWSRRFGEERVEMARQRAAELVLRKDDIKDRLQFLRAGRLIGQEKEVLEEYRALAPDDPEVQRELESFEVRWARDILARAGSMIETSSEDLARRSERLTPEQEASKAVMIEQTLALAKKEPRRAYDLALSLHFMDFNDEALNAVALAPDTKAGDWLKLELMLLARRFVDALEHANLLETMYADDPEAAFAVTYGRARALKGLGQNADAIDLLRGLVRVRPNYKSAQSLLRDWSGGDE